MVQYIHTPWRDQEELSRVRQQFYPPSEPPSTYAYAHASAKLSKTTAIPHGRDDTDGAHDALALALDAEKRQQQAVSRVSMWMQRGGCPHLVESTALLTAAILSDLHESRTRANSSSYAIRAAYSAAFSRFVTGLLDGQQDKLRKMSMYSIAKTIGLPATFVELRHQATHEQLPSLAKLRSAASNALAWIWDFYWKDLIPIDKVNSREANHQSDARVDLLVKYLNEQDETAKAGLEKHLSSWDAPSLLQTLACIAESSEKPLVILRALQLSRTILAGGFEILSGTAPGTPLPRVTDLEVVRVELQTLKDELEDVQAEHVDQPTPTCDEISMQSVGWTRYQGTWTPKPIGVV
ncbi:putative hydroxyacylglutathione hydrolase [Rosellinia necatrix]|uniref:Putative hydroxyacylglutathione hydrolase n=1 Tax=Rosellinia necatrix TaxID=77044 RepID=A0A1W2TLG3_ROSNE|nr:putative hydroxyacylglutathione hydrolase [Rosellinia necatrix]